MAVDPDKPFNREEMYLAKAAGEGTTVPDEPWSRKEAYLDKIAGRVDGMEEQIAALATDISLKGGVDSYDDLPEDAEIGDAYITEDTGILYVWVGDEWTPLNMQGSASDIFFVERNTSQTNWPVTTSFDDFKSAYNSGKLIIVPAQLTNIYGGNCRGYALFRLGVDPTNPQQIPDDTTGSFKLSAIAQSSANSNFSSYCSYSKMIITLDLANKTISIGMGALYPNSIVSGSAYVPASCYAVNATTGQTSDLTTTSKTNLVSAINELVTNMGGAKIVVLTQAQYDALATKDPSTLYIIKAA